jgi:IS5 family transposase
VKADLKTKRILRSTTTPANVHDSQVFEALLDDKDQGVLAESANHSVSRMQVRVEQMGADWCRSIGLNEPRSTTT